MALATRSAIADFINVGTRDNKIWAQCATGFTSLDESPSPQVESKVYIHEDEASPSITRYEPTFSFETEFWNDQEAVNKIYDIARNRKIGSNAEIEYLRTDLKIEEDGTLIDTVVAARLFTVAVEVTDIQGEGGEAITMSGNFNQVGAHIDGTFDLSTRTWTDGGSVPTPVARELELSFRPGSTGTKVKVSVEPKAIRNNTYLYKISSTEVTSLPEYGDYISTGWTAWDGYDELEVGDDKYLIVAEVSRSNLVKGIGQEKYEAEES